MPARDQCVDRPGRSGAVENQIGPPGPGTDATGWFGGRLQGPCDRGADGDDAAAAGVGGAARAGVVWNLAALDNVADECYRCSSS